MRLRHPARAAHILIVDDALSRELRADILVSKGYVLQTAHSGEAALAMVAEAPPDLVLLDILLTGIDGHEVTRRIKSNPATEHIPVIMISALENRAARMLGLNAGAEDFLIKPLDPAELCLRVRNLLRLKAHGDVADVSNHRLEAEVQLRTADLAQERDRAQRYLDTAATILLALDLDGRITLINRYGCSVLGWMSDELMGRSYVETCLPPRIRDEFTTKFHALLCGDLSVVENPVLTKTGEERLIEWRNTLLRDAAGQIIGTFSSGTDITERQQAVEALRTAEERMRFALHAADVGIWDMDHITGVMRWSETSEAHYGVLPGTFGGTFEAFLALIHPEDRAPTLKTIEIGMASGKDFSVQHRVIWPNGSVHWLTSAGRFLLGANGEPVRSVGITLDVSARHLLEKQFQQAQKMEAIGQLASGVAHDFNNLLTVILGFSEVVAADPKLASQHKDDLEEIMQAARRAASLTRQLLAFSRQQVMTATPLDVNVLIKDMAGMLGRLIGEHIEVVVALAPAVQPVLADRGQLEQVVMNLALNARDAMSGGGRLTVETLDVDLESSAFPEETVVPGRYVMLSVTDTGEGMSKETQQHLFEPFFTTKKAGEGTGLGLSTIYGIIKQSNGYISIHSELGRGTTFKVYLPRSAAHVALVEAAQNVAAPSGNQSSGTVLLVEDEAAVRYLSKRILEHAGYRVLEAANGDDAERIFAQHARSIDLVIADVIMPGCGGPELISRLHKQVPTLRILYMSGYTEQSVAHRTAIDRGPFVQKPFTAAELLRHVRDVLEAPRTATLTSPNRSPTRDITDTPARILIVDNHRHDRQVLEAMLAPEGYMLLTATSGEEALAAVAREQPDLILLDIVMPDMDGYQVAGKIKADPATKHIPVIMVTALDGRNARTHGMKAGAEDFLTKPVDRAELCLRIKNLLRLKAYGHYVRRLEEVELIKKGFLSTVSHELRTPLTSIRGSLGLLASGTVGELSSECMEIVGIAERNAIRLMALINDILDLERLETGTIELNFAQVSIDSILHRAMESMATLGHHVTVEAPEVSSTIWADADRIVQVLVNLLSNAVKFSPPSGKVTIGVVAQRGDIEFRVTDQGRGVPASHHRSIFEPFRQVQTSDAREKGGTGLGLAISRSIVQQHGGTIGVDSEDGAGSSFWFRIATVPAQPALALQPSLVNSPVRA
jgi:two-component system cell cycle sensor histidine kinase/response regulator CckA